MCFYRWTRHGAIFAHPSLSIYNLTLDTLQHMLQVQGVLCIEIHHVYISWHALSQPPLSKQITALEEHIVLWTVDQIVALAVFGPQCTWTCNVHTTLKKTLHKTQNTKEARANRRTGW